MSTQLSTKKALHTTPADFSEIVARGSEEKTTIIHKWHVLQIHSLLL